MSSAARDHTLFGVLPNSSAVYHGGETEWFIARVTVRGPADLRSIIDESAAPPRFEIVGMNRWTRPYDGYGVKWFASEIAGALNDAVQKGIDVGALGRPIWNVLEVARNPQSALPHPGEIVSEVPFESAVRTALRCADSNYERAVRYADYVGRLGKQKLDESKLVKAYLKREGGVDVPYLISSIERHRYDGVYRYVHGRDYSSEANANEDVEEELEP